MNKTKLDNELHRKLKVEKEKLKLKEVEKFLQSRQKSNEDPIQPLIEGLCDNNGLVRRSYSEALGNIGKPALPGLIKALLHSKNVVQRRAAAKTLKLVGDSSALPHLIKALTNDSDPVVQCSAAGAIAIFGEDAANHLIILLKSQELTEMQHGLAAWCLAFIGCNAPKAIKKAAQSKNNKVKSAAIAALEELIREYQDQKAIQLVQSSINDSAENVQIEAIRLVGKLYKVEAFTPILISKLKNKNPDIRKASIVSLMQLNIRESLSNLKGILENEQDENIKTIIKLAIKKISQ